MNLNRILFYLGVYNIQFKQDKFASENMYAR